ncbi:MAG: hypothetical protein ABF461_05500 [Zymomonas mobilis subsp. pomaceae]|uniref:Heme exporter protein D n=1 Tax=Zymomonas mobilis subsp. pomaceae (strain ATCC 29192 / DSM 22645 / JCM 10191 / CCUG 17912 / NBRC 13757 / NCIMB 11200 / NRRL B-4491 / Barker I) TaxID=579138 RepID=F8ET74_ZYMMT|nr:hypothetical protein [Zymomonas mobilis]AEI36964.1 hypothetical protein Zymop_0060 [Zymomonas mobilis subsp. pomaceae ATCC 29192]MDX5948337.1 hypothetical protein [Zymomonas mobilis subsp. pomaceae]GEB89093.1 hypothetical protein ZMO02_07300 [Zymomonas mobilis subsp. pomaceae]
MSGGYNQWLFVISAYTVVILATVGILTTSWLQMRRAEQRLPSRKISKKDPPRAH